jgi:hypothetical protein
VLIDGSTMPPVGPFSFQQDVLSRRLKVTPDADQQSGKTEPKGLLLMIAVAILVAIAITFLATRMGDTQQANETMGAGVVN